MNLFTHKSLVLSVCALLSGAVMHADELRHMADSTMLLEVVEISARDAMRTARTAHRPIASSVIGPVQIRHGVRSITDLSSLVSNLYIPDYGSRRSAAIYLRGTGARSAGQTVAMYVDGIPMLNKSAINFDLLGVRTIEVLRGPQGTLLGRNAMAGAINLYTTSGLDDRGGQASLSVGSHGLLNASALVNHRLSDRWGISLGIRGQRHNGYWYNQTRQTQQDSLKSVGAYAKLSFRPSERFSANLSTHFDYVDQGAFPYRRVADEGTLEALTSGEAGLYRRKALHTRLSMRWQPSKAVVLASSTGLQWMSDHTAMDMDALPMRAFYVDQYNRQLAFTQELVLRNAEASSRYQWSVGAFGFYDSEQYDVPIQLQEDGLTMISRRLPRTPSVELSIDASNVVHSPNSFSKPEWGIALYHESTLRDVLTRGFSLTVGLRLDYSQQTISYDSQLALRLGMRPLTTPGAPISWLSKPTHLKGTHRQGHLVLLPKLAIQYEGHGWAIYGSMTKGYKSGGYNEQHINDIIQQAQMQDLMSLSGRTSGFDASGLADRLAYEPETAWSYELGFRLREFGIVDHLTATAYYMDVRNLQLTKFVPSSAGRIVSNAGGSYTIGGEVVSRLHLASNLSAQLSYGVGIARFSGNEEASAPLAGRYVPFIPQHTYSVGLNAYETINTTWLTAAFASVEAQGLGQIYWTEDNAYSQHGHTTLSGRMGLELGAWSCSIWGRNLLDSKYLVFLYRSFGSSFAQQATPRTFGIDVSYRF